MSNKRHQQKCSLELYSKHPKLEVTQQSADEWRDKQIVVYLYDGILVSNKKRRNCWHAKQHEWISNTMLSEINQILKSLSYVIYSSLRPGKISSNDTNMINQFLMQESVGPQDWLQNVWQNLCGDGNSLYLDWVSGWTGHTYICQTPQTINFNVSIPLYVNFVTQ